MTPATNIYNSLRKPWDTYREPTFAEINSFNRALTDYYSVTPRPEITKEYNDFLQRDAEQRKLI